MREKKNMIGLGDCGRWSWPALPLTAVVQRWFIRRRLNMDEDVPWAINMLCESTMRKKKKKGKIWQETINVREERVKPIWNATKITSVEYLCNALYMHVYICIYVWLHLCIIQETKCIWPLCECYVGSNILLGLPALR